MALNDCFKNQEFKRELQEKVANGDWHTFSVFGVESMIPAQSEYTDILNRWDKMSESEKTSARDKYEEKEERRKIKDELEKLKNEKIKEIKLNIKFLPKTGILILNDQDGKENKIKLQGQVQKEVLRVIFRNPEDVYKEWSLYDIADILGQTDVDEKAVNNAIYHFNQKVKLTIPLIENFFELTKYSTQINQKYINKN